MKPQWVRLLGCTMVVLFGAEHVSAGWNNVFQVTSFVRGRRQQRVANYYVAPAATYAAPVVGSTQAYSSPAGCCDPCQQTQCSTSYVQRCYYQPITTYQTQSYYQKVTSYRTSYYYEPVTCYRYSCYYDPCTCSYRRVAVPSTSYRLRSKCCPVTSWVQRCCQVPVTSYRRCCYWQPQTTCCTAPACCPTTTNAVQQPPVQAGAPNVTESRSPANTQLPDTQQYDRNYGPPEQGSQSKQSRQGAYPQNSSPPPKVTINRIVSNPEQAINGKVVRSDNAPRSGASLLFVNIDRKYSRQNTTANSNGRFNVSLAAGRWEVYELGNNGQKNYRCRIDVRERNMPFFTLVSN